MLPGDVVKCQGGLCDDCGEPAVVTIVGETDSFGSEFLGFCQNCYDKFLNEEPEPQMCEWCKKEAVLSPMRDFGEGLNGPVYMVCSVCRKKENDLIDEEIKEDKKREAEKEDDDFYYYNYPIGFTCGKCHIEFAYNHPNTPEGERELCQVCKK